MTSVQDKYRGTPAYDAVRAELIRAAEYRGETSYAYLAQLMDLPARGSHMVKQVGQMLAEISEDELEADRPLLSAVTLGTDGKPGKGFFALARTLEKLGEDEDELEFWENELEAVYAEWKRTRAIAAT